MSGRRWHPRINRLDRWLMRGPIALKVYAVVSAAWILVMTTEALAGLLGWTEAAIAIAVWLAIFTALYWYGEYRDRRGAR